MNRLRPSAILRYGLGAAGEPLLVFSLYLLFAGHNQPGGGFSGGLVAGVGVTLAWSAGGLDQLRQLIPFRATVLLGSGLVLAAGTGFVSLLAGGAFLESGVLDLTLPLFGEVKVVSALFFDMGVYLVVLGMAVGLVRAVGERVEADPAGRNEEADR